MKKYIDIFITMMKIGLFTFGGGYAMIALLESEFVAKKKWLDREEFLDMVAISESTPGPIAINAATYIGYKTLGLLGALLATVAVALPSFVIIFLISLFFDAFLTFTIVANAFRGIQVCVVYLILSAGLKLLRGMKKTPISVSVVSLTVLCMVAFSLFAVRFSTVFYILIAGVVGIFVYCIGRIRANKKEEVKK